MDGINGEPKPTPRRGQSYDSVDHQQRLFEWKERNSWPFLPPRHMPEGKTILPPERTPREDRQPSYTPYTVSSPIPSLSCDICGEKYFSRRMLNDHNENCIKPKPESSYGTYGGGLPIDFGLSQWMLKQLLRFIDWLNAITGADKPKSKPKSKINRSPLMTTYEHMICDMYEEEDRREDVIAQWKQSHHWLRRLMDWIFGTTYNFVDVPDSYFESVKAKKTSEQMATLEELFEDVEDENTHPDWELAKAMDRYFENKIKVQDRERGTPHTKGY